MSFEFATATKIIFGSGSIRQIGSLAAKMGNRAFIVTGNDRDRGAILLDLLKKEGVLFDLFCVSKEPTTTIVLEGVAQAKKTNCDMVIGCGGGSPIDTGKAIAALLNNEGELLDYLEVIGHGKPLTKPSAPYIAIPTTAGTGAEVTRNAVLGSPEHQVKVSLRSPSMLPSLALIDPELTYSMPPKTTANTGLDAFTHLLESFVSNQANPLTDGICREGLHYVARSLVKAFQKGDDGKAREDMALASFFGGLALANAKLGAVHGFAGPMGGMFDAPHGALCARFLPFVMETNLRALTARLPNSPVLDRYVEVARIVTGNPEAQAADGIGWAQEISDALHIAPLAELGVQKNDFLRIVEKSENASSMKGNPVALTREELTHVLEQAL
ncbi:MAG: iron-containing alcohol dehydrogenase [SAR324 cluster bacterium]|nr:iron-containing alcohol dehydrogenase [SAR324 cluster bacterium]